jgi:hypothetical protein
LRAAREVCEAALSCGKAAQPGCYDGVGIFAAEFLELAGKGLKSPLRLLLASAANLTHG